MSKTKKEYAILRTPFEKSESGWEEYPRPQLKRDSYLSLCGPWQLSLESGESLGEIQVPFPPGSRLSGIGRPGQRDTVYVYEKTFCRGDELSGERVLLHFGAVDQVAEVFLNGVFVGGHRGGYLPFTLDVTDAVLWGENTLRVVVRDTMDTDLALGKQSEKRGGMWYTPVSGIWQAVWLESVPADHIRAIRTTKSPRGAVIEIEGGRPEKTLTLQTPEGEVEYTFFGDRFEINIEKARLWSPDDPYLYHFTLTDGADRVTSYFALRTVTVEMRSGRPYICLNGRPFYFHGLLDQGYFPDGIYLPASPEGYRWDIQSAKRLGFNMLRKHIKIEPQLFYYYCDLYGMIVFQDMVNSGKYSFIRDTALPTVGFKKIPERRASFGRRQAFEADCRETVSLLYNHPCVCYYTIFNEGWGQYDSDRIYGEMKALDPTRIWDSTSGWFFKKESDVRSEHVYFRKIKLKSCADRPLVLSEFGGYSYKDKDHSFNPVDNYGYKSFESESALTRGLCDLYIGEVLPEIRDKGLCATVLTQLSDVEDETNGLLTYDRQVVKVNEDEMRAVIQSLKRAFEDSLIGSSTDKNG